MKFFEYKAKKVWIEDSFIHVMLQDGREGKLPIQQFKSLANAHPEALHNFEIINEYALHWPQLDEDLSVEGFFVPSDALMQHT